MRWRRKAGVVGCWRWSVCSDIVTVDFYRVDGDADYSDRYEIGRTRGGLSEGGISL
jgi:hypothetical protein